MATLRTFLCALLLFINLSLFVRAHTTNYLPDLRPRGSSTTTALDCSQTAAGNVSACYPNLNLIPTCCRPCIVNVTLLQPCASTDFRCLCAHASQFQIQALDCINGTCSTEDEQTAINYYYSYCNSMNYPLSAVPSSSTPSPTSSSSASTSSSATAIPATSKSPATGAAIGVTFGALLLISAATIFLLHRRRRKASGIQLLNGVVPDALSRNVGNNAFTSRKDLTPGNDTLPPNKVPVRHETLPPSYPNVQEIDGKAVQNIMLEERQLPQLPTPVSGRNSYYSAADAAVVRDLSDSSNAETLYRAPTRTVYEMDGRRPSSLARSRSQGESPPLPGPPG